MEESSIAISNFCKTLASFCKHLHLKSNALKDSVERRPIPLESATSTFTQCLNRRVSSASADLNLLESMAFGTVSFEELLGHCNELYKKNQFDLVQLEDRLTSFGYIPETVISDEEEGSELAMAVGANSKMAPSLYGGQLSSSSSAGSIMKRLEEDDLFEDSLSLQNLGLSDVCLATLASEVNGDANNMKSLKQPVNYNDVALRGSKGHYQPETRILGMTGGELEDMPKFVASAKVVINVSKNDYENLPSFMTSVASWEDLKAAVEKMNSALCRQEKQKENNLFYQDDLASLGLGPKVRSFLLLLLRMNKLVVETADGSIAYRVL